MNPERERLSHAIREAFLEAAEKVVIALEAGPAAKHSVGSDADHLLTAVEVATRFGRSVAWVYRNSRGWPFTRRISRKTVRFSDAGLTRYLANLRD